MIYFVQPVDGGPIKIGYTDYLDARLKQLEAHYRTPLALLATMPGGQEEERAIHEQFSHLRFGRTEQFRPAPDLMAFIGRPLLVDPNPNAVAALGHAYVTVNLSPEVHRKLRVVAAERNKPMSVFACDLVEQTVTKLYGDKRG